MECGSRNASPRIVLEHDGFLLPAIGAEEQAAPTSDEKARSVGREEETPPSWRVGCPRAPACHLFRPVGAKDDDLRKAGVIGGQRGQERAARGGKGGGGGGREVPGGRL